MATILKPPPLPSEVEAWSSECVCVSCQATIAYGWADLYRLASIPPPPGTPCQLLCPACRAPQWLPAPPGLPEVERKGPNEPATLTVDKSRRIALILRPYSKPAPTSLPGETRTSRPVAEGSPVRPDDNDPSPFLVRPRQNGGLGLAILLVFGGVVALGLVLQAIFGR